MNPIPNQQTALALGQQPMVNTTPNIDMQALVDEWRLSKSYVEQYTRDFVKLDTIVGRHPAELQPGRALCWRHHLSRSGPGYPA
jgi:hypothetical protein